MEGGLLSLNADNGQVLGYPEVADVDLSAAAAAAAVDLDHLTVDSAGARLVAVPPVNLGVPGLDACWIVGDGGGNSGAVGVVEDDEFMKMCASLHVPDPDDPDNNLYTEVKSLRRDMWRLKHSMRSMDIAVCAIADSVDESSSSSIGGLGPDEGGLATTGGDAPHVSLVSNHNSPYCHQVQQQDSPPIQVNRGQMLESGICVNDTSHPHLKRGRDGICTSTNYGENNEILAGEEGGLQEVRVGWDGVCDTDPKRLRAELMEKDRELRELRAELARRSLAP
ncbi:unnamed protein product [Choristocarpus tenellus]